MSNQTGLVSMAVQSDAAWNGYALIGCGGASVVSMTAPIANTPSLSSGGSLVSGTPYYWKVSAVNGLGETISSNEVTVTPSGANLTATVTWSAVAGAMSYKLFRTTTSGTYGASSLVASGILTTSYIDTGAALSSGTLLTVATDGFITLAKDPINALHAATKQYVDAVATGLDVKLSVRAGTTGALAAHTRSGNILTATANGAFPAQDGVTLALNDSLLVKDEGGGTHLENGPYTLTQVGDGSNPWKLTRRTDADASIEVTSGMFTFITEGTLQKGEGWVLTTADPITLNTTALTFTQFTGAGEITAGNGIVKVANTLHFAQSAAYTSGAIPFASSTSTIGFDTANLLWDGTNHRLGLLTVSPTHTLTLASTSTGLSSYNTSDQTTNYERATLLWSSNAFSVLMEKGGSGVNRTFNVSGTYSAASGVQTAFSITPTINQSGTAGYTGLLVNATESGLGSGSALLADFQIGSTSRMFLSNSGRWQGTTANLVGTGHSFTVNLTDVIASSAALSLGSVFTPTSNNAQTVYALSETVTVAGTFTKSVIIGHAIQMMISGSGNISNLVGVAPVLTHSGGATIANHYFFQIANLSITGGSLVTNMYGFYIGPLKVTGVTNGYAFYQAGASDLNLYAGKTQFGSTSVNPVEVMQTQGRFVLDINTYATSKFDSQGVAWSGAAYNAIIFNGASADKPEISWLRGSRSYPEFSIRQHTTSDKGGQIWVGPGTVAPTRILSFTAGGVGLLTVIAPTAYLHLDAGTSAASTSPLKFTSGTLLTAKEAGAVGYNNDYYHTRNGGTVRFGLGGSIFDHFADAGNTTTTETDLYTDTLPASTFDSDGTKVFADYGGTFVSSGTATRQIKVYFGGTVILDTGALSISAAASWSIYVMLIRASSSSVRYLVALQTSSAALAAYSASGAVTGLTLTNTQVLKITGTAAGVGAATNDLVAKLGQVSILAPAA